jgi:hypothetical protein
VCGTTAREEHNRLRDQERLRLDLADDYREDEDYWDSGERECSSCSRGTCGFCLDDEYHLDLILARKRELRVPLIDLARMA